MKTALTTLLVILTIQNNFAQRRYLPMNKLKLVTFQIVPTILDYHGMKYGFAIGANINEVLSINYFHTRDYSYGDNYEDNRYGGVYTNLSIPVKGKFEVGPSVRIATANMVWQKPMLSAELRFKFSKSFKVGVEKGLNGDHDLMAAKFIFNLY